MYNCGFLLRRTRRQETQEMLADRATGEDNGEDDSKDDDDDGDGVPPLEQGSSSEATSGVPGSCSTSIGRTYTSILQQSMAIRRFSWRGWAA